MIQYYWLINEAKSIKLRVSIKLVFKFKQKSMAYDIKDYYYGVNNFQTKEEKGKVYLGFEDVWYCILPSKEPYFYLLRPLDFILDRIDFHFLK